MRKLPYLLALLLLSLMLLAAAASAHALTLPTVAAQGSPFVDPPEEEAEADDEAEDEAVTDDESDNSEVEVDDEGEDCGVEEDELCEEETEDEDEECLIEDASASFTAAPGAGEVRLRVHYRAFEPTAVIVDASLQGSKGKLHLGSQHARFHRAGVYRYDFSLGSKQMVKAVAAKEFEVSLRAVGAPAGCEMDLATRAPHRAK
jgi:hypothetical protein